MTRNSCLPGMRERTWKGTCVSGGIGGRRGVGINFRQRIACRNPVEISTEASRNGPFWAATCGCEHSLAAARSTLSLLENAG